MPPGCTGEIPPPPWTAKTYAKFSLDGRIRLAHASSPDGPWTSQPLPVLQPQPGDSWDAFTTNAAPALADDGSLLLVYRGSNVSADAAIGLTRATSWEGPYERLNGGRPLFTDHSEDPFIYKGRRGFHIVMHHMPPNEKRPASFPYNETAWDCGLGNNACIGHAFAEHYEGPWFYSPVPAATPDVDWTDGSRERLSRRERPQVLTNSEGDVEVLYNGVCCREGPGHPRPQDTYTLAVPTAAHKGSYGL
jgi:hypothetical protein